MKYKMVHDELRYSKNFSCHTCAIRAPQSPLPMAHSSQRRQPPTSAVVIHMVSLLSSNEALHFLQQEITVAEAEARLT